MNYPLDIGYPALIVSDLENSDAAWLAQYPPEMPVGRPIANYPSGEHFSVEYETTPSLVHSETPTDMQTPSMFDQTNQLEEGQMMTGNLWGRQCQSDTSVKCYGVAFDEEERRMLDDIKGKHTRDPYPCASSLPNNQATDLYPSALPTQEDDDSSTNTIPSFGTSTENTIDRQGDNLRSCDDAAPQVKPPRKKNRARHNVVEQRYRENLNTRIIQLRDRIPSLQTQVNHEDDARFRRTKRGTICKATILLEAGEYIEQLQSQMMQLQHQKDTLERLVERLVAALEGDSKFMKGLPTGM
ncbi:MAG: hypothetical protein Q9217_000428 [Psora testacea]